MVKMDDLNKTYEEMIVFIKSKGIRIFPGNLMLAERALSCAMWDPKNDDWKAFIEIAKDEGAKTMIVEVEKGEGDHLDDIGSLTLAWIKDGIAFIFVKQAEWWMESLKEEPEIRELHSIPIRYESEERIPELSLIHI